jgi:type IV pilus assembly protein PilW
MKSNTMKIKYHFNKGFTLIELMITVILSLLITYAIAQVLISSNRTSVTSDGMSQSQETGRFVMSFLGKHIREAGLDSTTDTSRSTGAFISCGEFPNLADDFACIEENGGGEDQDAIQNFGIHGDRLAIARVTPEGSLVDCTGATGYNPTGTVNVVPYAKDDYIINTFWVHNDGVRNNLMCQGFLFDPLTSDVDGSSSAQAIANGVEAMQLLYGEANAALSSDGRNVSRYLPAPVNPALPIANEVQNWSRTYAVKVSIMTRSLTAVTNSAILRRYVLGNAAPYDMTDAVSRQVFTTTFVINNIEE